MYQFNFIDRKHQDAPAVEAQVDYLVLSSEPAEVEAPRLKDFYYQNRYLAKRRVMRNLRRLRRDQLGR